jgi:hypothetical protein
MSDDNMTPIRTLKSPVEPPLPPREVLLERLEVQRERVLNAQGICALAVKMVSDVENNGGFDEMEDQTRLRGALQGLAELLDSIKNAIDPQGDLLLPEEEA